MARMSEPSYVAPITHGTRHGYVGYSCRCGRCTHANRIGSREASRRYAAKRAATNRARMQKIRDERGCSVGSDCEGRLEWDHIDPSTKTDNVAHIIKKSWAVVEAELAKCQVLCFKHHIEKTVREGDNVR